MENIIITVVAVEEELTGMHSIEQYVKVNRKRPYSYKCFR